MIERHEYGTMPRINPGGPADATVETRDVLAVNGPPVLSMGRMVESARRPCAFVYGKQWQGFVETAQASLGGSERELHVDQPQETAA